MSQKQLWKWQDWSISDLALPSSKASIYINSSSDTRTLCTYDLLTLYWNITRDVPPSEHSIAFIRADQREVTYGSLALEAYAWQQEIKKSTIKCALDHEFCQVGFQSASVDRGKLILQFDKDTNEQAFLDATAVKGALTIRPYLNDTAVGDWLSASKLELSVSEAYLDRVLAASQRGELSVSIAPDPLGMGHDHTATRALNTTTTAPTLTTSYHGYTSFRPTESGQYKVFVIHTESRSLVSGVHKVKVELCGDSLPPPASRSTLEVSRLTHDNSSPETNPPKPLVRYKGVIALSGKVSSKGMSIPHKALSSEGSWALTLWVKLLQGPTGEFRCLFYKGDGQDPNRTPSAWLLPTTSRLAMRASTPSNLDLGADTLLDIPRGKWVHMAFVFNNHTTTTPATTSTSDDTHNNNISDRDKLNITYSTHDGTTLPSRQKMQVTRGPYVMSVYLDGNMDISLTYPDNAIPNQHPLYLFKDLSHQGPRGFACDIIAWDSPLSQLQVQTLARKSRSADHRDLTGPVDLALGVVGPYVNLHSSNRRQTHHSDSVEGTSRVTGGTTNKPIVSEFGDEGINELYNEQQYHKNLHADTADLKATSIPAREMWFDLLSADAEEESSMNGPHRLSPLDAILTHIDKALSECAPAKDRLDLYAEASVLGHVDSLYRWAMLTGFGAEIPNSPCGIEEVQATSSKARRYHDVRIIPHDDDGDAGRGWSVPYALWYREYEVLVGEEAVSDQVISAVALIAAAQRGHSAALVPLSTMISTAVGISGLLRDLHSAQGYGLMAYIAERVPLPTQSERTVRAEHDMDQIVDLTLVASMSDLLRDIIMGNENSAATDSPGVEHPVLAVGGGASASGDLKRGRGSSREMNGHGSRGRWRTRALTTDILPYDVTSTKSVFALSLGVESSRTRGPGASDALTHLASGLLILAAADDNADAHMALYKRYQEGTGGLSVDIDVAAHYASLAAAKSADEFHKVGAQPIVESDRITDATELVIGKGNSGADDQHIQMLSVQAQEGDVASMLSLGELYYYGSRGLARDQTRALDLYSQAADLGNEHGMCGAAGMWLKGEGAPKNVSKALGLYDTAAAQGSIRALNGLGYVYFFGNGDEVAINQTKAYYYFLRATEYGGDSDSWFNAGYCLEHGVGIRKDVVKAATFYRKGATEFGHFDSVFALGSMHLQGEGVARSPREALYFLSAANQVGPWSGWLRRGLNLYLQGQTAGESIGYYDKSVMCYLHAGELGYEVAVSNSAFILRRKMTTATKHRFLGSQLAYTSSQAISTALLSGTKHTHVDDADGSESSAMSLSDYLSEGVLVRQLSLSANLGNAESAQLLGNHLLHTKASRLFGSGRTSSVKSRCVALAAGCRMAGIHPQKDSCARSVDTTLSREDCPQSPESSISNTPTHYSCPDTLPAIHQQPLSYVLQHQAGDIETNARAKAALWWFARSSAMGNHMGSLQAGLMHHFGIGTPGGEVNTHRAKRYYRSVLESDLRNDGASGGPVNGGSGVEGGSQRVVVGDPMPATAQYATQGLLWLATEAERNVFARSVNSLFGWIAKVVLEVV